MYAEHAQHSLRMCNFPFQVWSLWGCKIMFLEKETIPSNKWCSCPSRAQLEFFERSITYLQRNGVIERIVTCFQIMVQLSKEAADSMFFLVSKTAPSNKWCSFQTDGSWVSLKGVLHCFKEMVLLSNTKASWISLRGTLRISLKDTLHILTQYWFC